MKKSVVLLLIAVILLSCGSAFAASPWTEKDTYKEKVLSKLDFGFKNTLAGWTELFNQPIKSHKDGKTVAEGVLRGIYYAVADTVGGILHIATFPVLVDVPLPNNGVQLS